MPTAIAFVPARGGSKRLPGKNIRPLGGHPVIAYTIAAARASGVFSKVVVSTDSEETAEIARHYGASVPFMRPAELAGDLSPDIEWVRHAIRKLEEAGEEFEAFAILRPTSPFRQAETIERAWRMFTEAEGADSLRAVEPCSHHPGKMWRVEGDRLRPLLDDGGAEPPWHSMPYQGLAPVYQQNASLEIAWKRVPGDYGTIAGVEIVPFVTEGYEGFDFNRPEDWWLGEILLEKGLASLPKITSSARSA